MQGNCEDVKEQFAKAIEAVKDIHQMKMSSTKDVADDLNEKMLAPLMAMLK